jgi:predicted acylesterase/phospholipase RssA
MPALKVTIYLLVSIFLCSGCGTENKMIQNPEQKKGTALIITGAAAKISQEIALLEHLFATGMLDSIVFISGASSGALNAVVLNAILQKKYSWDSYNNLLFNLCNDSIFIRTSNKLPLDTSPLRKMIQRIVVDSLGYKTLADLPYPTSISVVNSKFVTTTGRTYRLSNYRINAESDPTLGIVDVLMASTSYPFAFPPAYIQNVKTIPYVPYIDGGVADDHVPYKALVDFEKYTNVDIDKVIIISRKRDIVQKIGDEAEAIGIDRFQFFDRLGVSPEAISYNGFLKRLKDFEKESPVLAEKTYVYMPDFENEFLMFDFSTLREQYELTHQWALTHEPVPLRTYLESLEKTKS